MTCIYWFFFGGGGGNSCLKTMYMPFSKKFALIIMVHIICEDYISVFANIYILEVKLHLAKIWSLMLIKKGNSYDI
jgi:hypothetical protein